MKKIYVVKNNREFNNIINNGNKYKSNFFTLCIMNNNFNYNRYGIAISKKIGNAVIRNKYKRQIKDIIDDIKISISGYDLVLIAKVNIKTSNYNNIKDDIIKLFNEIGEKYEK